MCDRDGNSLTPGRRAALLSIAMVLVVGCAVLSLGLRAVPKSELTAVMAAVMYFLAVSALQPGAPPESISAGRIKPLAVDRQLSRATVRFFLLCSFLLSIVAPWVWIVGFRPSYRHLHLLGPHLFLMMTQTQFEIWSYRTTVNVVIRIGIPVAFVSYRMRVLVSWVRDSLMVVEPMTTSDKFMLFLASANFCFWGVMLFYVLLLKVCPPYFLERDQLVQSRQDR